jgi:hypothetical protein
VTAWADSSITFTAAGLPAGGAYLFVTNNSDASNASGYAVTLEQSRVVATWIM